MSPWVITLIIVLIVVGIFVALYVLGNKLQKQQISQKEQIKEAAQMTSMLIIDKKMMKLKDAGLPKAVMDQAPKRYRNAKMPIVKAKVGPQTVNLICDDGIFDDLPTKCEVKAMVSGIYITEIKSVRGKHKNNQPEQPKKKSFAQKMRKKQSELQAEYAKEEKIKEAKKAAKEAEKKKKEQAKKITN